MAAGFNKISIIGHLGRDPETRYTQSSNTAVCSFSVAVTEKRKEADGYKDHTEWFNVISFGKQAETMGQYLKKGRQVYVEGKLQSKSYVDKEGKNRFSLEIVANQIVFLGSNNEEKAAPSSGGSSIYESLSKKDNHQVSLIDDDDIPF